MVLKVESGQQMDSVQHTGDDKAGRGWLVRGEYEGWSRGYQILRKRSVNLPRDWHICAGY